MNNLVIKKCANQITSFRTLKQLCYTSVRFTASATNSHEGDDMPKKSALFISGEFQKSNENKHNYFVNLIEKGKRKIK